MMDAEALDAAPILETGAIDPAKPEDAASGEPGEGAEKRGAG